MELKLLLIFIGANILNVIIQTVKSLATIKCGKGMAALVNALAYGFYTYIIVLTTCDLPLYAKMLVVAMCNLVGVFAVKWGEEKATKDKERQLSQHKASCSSCFFVPFCHFVALFKKALTRFNAKLP